jgi:hypothetical protein
MKPAFAFPGLVAGAAFLVLAAGCATGDLQPTPGAATRADPPTGSHIVRRPSPDQEREKTGDRPAGQAVGVPPLNRP